MEKRILDWVERYDLQDFITGKKWETFSKVDPRKMLQIINDTINAAENIITPDAPPPIEYASCSTQTEEEKQQIPYVSGKVFEEELYDDIRKNLPYANIVSCAKSAHTGDIIIHQPTYSVIVDAKNYSHTVPTKEITKLFTDLESQSIKYGILVSKSGVAKSKGRISIVHESSKSIIVIAHYQHPIEVVFAVNVIGILSTDRVNIDKVSTVIEAIVPKLNQAVLRFRTMRVDFARCMENIERELNEVVQIFKVCALL